MQSLRKSTSLIHCCDDSDDEEEFNSYSDDEDEEEGVKNMKTNMEKWPQRQVRESRRSY